MGTLQADQRLRGQVVIPVEVDKAGAAGHPPEAIPALQVVADMLEPLRLAAGTTELDRLQSRR